MTIPSQTDSRGEPRVSITTQGAKSDKKVTAYVKAMLEALKLSGEFTLTTHFGNDDGHAGKHGIRIRTHSHSGVELEIQPERGSSRFYESWLSWKGHDSSMLRDELNKKFAGQKRFILGEWRDPDKIITFKTPTSVSERAPESTPPPVEEIDDDSHQNDESLRGYATDETLRNSMLSDIYDTLQQKSFTAEQFVVMMREKSGINGSTQGLKSLLRRLTKKGYFKSQTSGLAESFRLSSTIVEFLAELGLITVQGSVISSPVSPDTGEIVALLLELSHRAEKFREARDEIGRIEDSEKLLESEVTTLEGLLEKARKRLELIRQRKAELTMTTSDPAFSEAGAEVAKIVQRHQS